MLGENVKTLGKEKGYTQEEMVTRNRHSGRIWLIVGVICAVFIVFYLLFVLVNVAAFSAYSTNGELTVEEVPMEEDAVLIEP